MRGVSSSVNQMDSREGEPGEPEAAQQASLTTCQSTDVGDTDRNTSDPIMIPNHEPVCPTPANTTEVVIVPPPPSYAIRDDDDDQKYASSISHLVELRSLSTPIAFYAAAIVNQERIYRAPKSVTHEEVHRFLQIHSNPPETEICIELYHVSTDSDGNDSKIVDWSHTVSLKKWITCVSKIDFEASIDGFVNSKATLKKLKLTKEIMNWDNDAFQELVRAKVRSKHGSKHDVRTVHRFINNSKVVSIQGSNAFNDCVNSNCAKVVCAITCACLFWCPVKQAMKQTFHTKAQFLYRITPTQLVSVIENELPHSDSINRSACSIM